MSKREYIEEKRGSLAGLATATLLNTMTDEKKYSNYANNLRYKVNDYLAKTNCEADPHLDLLKRTARHKNISLTRHQHRLKENRQNESCIIF